MRRRKKTPLYHQNSVESDWSSQTGYYNDSVTDPWQKFETWSRVSSTTSKGEATIVDLSLQYWTETVEILCSILERDGSLSKMDGSRIRIVFENMGNSLIQTSL